MKKKLALLLFVFGCFTHIDAQVVLQEDFTAGWTPSASNWQVVNTSTPVGSTSWFQGNAGQFPAYNGAPNDYIAADVNNVNYSTGVVFPQPPISLLPKVISDWLITPTLTIYNGAVLQFATRAGQPYTKPNRLQVRMSPTNPGSVTISNSAAVGTFTSLLLDINPTYSTGTTNTAVVGTTVSDYPAAWTVYSVQVSGVTGTVTGRFAFRYYVVVAGAQRASYIGIDAVKYTLPCMTNNDQSFTVCPNQSFTLSGTSELASTTYSWAGPGGFSSNASVITVTAPPSGTAVYTLYPSVGGSVSCGTSAQASITVSNQMSLQVTASEATVCSGNSITLTAVSPASAYAWGTTGGVALAGSGASVVVTPTATTTYTVGGSFGTLSNLCAGSANVPVNVLPLPVLTYTRIGGSCAGSTVSLHASGGSDYVWYGTDFNAAQGNPMLLLQGSTVGPHTFTVFGKDANGCVGSIASGYTVSALPTVAVISSQTPACLSGGVDLTASGADTYTWSGAGIAANSTVNPLSYSTGTASGSRTIVVSGVSSEGCAGTSTVVLTTVLCTGIENYAGNNEAAVYPNPFSNELKISGVTGSVEIYNTLGQAVVKTTLRNNNETIYTTELPKGVYILKTYNKDGEPVKTVKLLKN